jgi:hypothetical protein
MLPYNPKAAFSVHFASLFRNLISEIHACLSDRHLPFTHPFPSPQMTISDTHSSFQETTPPVQHSRLLTDNSLSFTKSLVLRTQSYSMEPTHLSNTAHFPVMENTRGIWSALSRYLCSTTPSRRAVIPSLNGGDTPQNTIFPPQTAGIVAQSRALFAKGFFRARSNRDMKLTDQKTKEGLHPLITTKSLYLRTNLLANR